MMLDLPPFLAFVAAASLLTLTPGIDTAMVLRAATASALSGAMAAIGIALGCLTWGLVASFGLGALLQASTLAYAALKWAGAAYLFWLGLRLILDPRAGFGADAEKSNAALPSIMRRGFLTNILNPKVGVFYVTFLPQFIPHGANVFACSLLLAATHVVLTLVWFSVLIAAVIPLAIILRRPAVVGMLDRVTGAVFIGFGVKLAVSRG